MAARVSLDDKYALDRGCVFTSGTQALVRLPLMQLERDHAVGLNTAFSRASMRISLRRRCGGLDCSYRTEHSSVGCYGSGWFHHLTIASAAARALASSGRLPVPSARAPNDDSNFRRIRLLT